MRRIVVAISALSLAVLILSSCTDQAQSPQQTQQTTKAATPRPTIMLHPGVSVPASCPITPVYLGPFFNTPGLEDIPWMKAQPESSGMAAYLWFAGDYSQTHAYQPLPTGKPSNQGSGGKILWIVDNPHSTTSLDITGEKLGGSHDTFQQTIPMAVSPPDNYPSIAYVPTPGCWRFNLKSGADTATVVLWVVPY